MIKLIASDVDGTLLRGGEGDDIPQEIFQLILELKKEGILFVAASGRQYPNLRRLFGPVQEEIGYICENGCMAFYEDQKLHQALMDTKTAHELIRAVEDIPQGEVLLSGERVSYIKPGNQEYYRHMKDVVRNNVALLEDLYQMPEPYMKVSAYRKEGISAYAGQWKKRFGDRVTVATAGFTWLDNMPQGVNKGVPLKKFMERFGISPQECMAFGDEYNDLEMLKLAEYGFAMDTARTKVKETCKYHTSSVAQVLREVLEDKFEEERWHERVQ